MNTDTFADLWGGTRSRVLIGYAARSRQAAHQLRERTAQFPKHAASMLAEADGLDRYADACDLAAGDLTLPNPEWDPAPYRGEQGSSR